MEQDFYHTSLENKNISVDNRSETMFEPITVFESDKVLLIEDNPGDARLVEILLSESDLLNCEITHRTTLAEGIKVLEEEENFAAILLDLSLPDSRGFDTLSNLIARFPNNNIIVLTGHSDKALGINAVKAGAQDFLIKGEFDADLLSKTLRFSIERNSVLKRLEDTQHIARIGNWDYNVVTKHFSATDEVYRIFGYPPRKISFTSVDLENVEHPFHIFYKIHQSLESSSEKKIRKDFEVKDVNGDTRYIFVQCMVKANSENQLIYNGTIQDITERKQAEKQILKSQERYQSIFTKSKDAIFICTMEGKLVDFNPATVDLTGYSATELKKIDVANIYEDADFLEDFIDNLKTGKVVQEREVDIETSGGATRNCLLTASYLESDDFVGYNCILRDVTEQRQAKELREARDLAQKADKLKEQFIASISHDMRTPMNAILGMSNLVLKTDLDEEQNNYITNIKQSSEILLGIVNDILEIATLQNGKINFENNVFDLHSLLANMVNVMHYKLDEKDLKFELTVDEKIPQALRGDKLRLNQVLYNIVGNAIKFTDNGFIKIGVELLNESIDSVHIKFSIQDSGIGIPKDKLGAIFETFTRIREKERIYEGTGLGLSIAKRLVEYQGGKIWVESEYGEGSTFYFDLILEPGDIDKVDDRIDTNIPAASREENIVLDENMEFNLLLVEDHKMNQLVAQKTLKKQWDNIHITIADNGKIATDYLKEKSFDIILMDLQMPIMDGYEATKYIRNEMPPEVARLPILAMTAHANIAKDEKYKEYGMDDFVLKPFKPEQLFQKITKYVNINR